MTTKIPNGKHSSPSPLFFYDVTKHSMLKLKALVSYAVTMYRLFIFQLINSIKHIQKHLLIWESALTIARFPILSHLVF